MTKTTQDRELLDTEVDAVTGGAGKHIDMVDVELVGSGPGGGSAPTPASAWNACLNGYGFPSMA